MRILYRGDVGRSDAGKWNIEFERTGEMVLKKETGSRNTGTRIAGADED